MTRCTWIITKGTVPRGRCVPRQSSWRQRRATGAYGRSAGRSQPAPQTCRGPPARMTRRCPAASVVQSFLSLLSFSTFEDTFNLVSGLVWYQSFSTCQTFQSKEKSKMYPVHFGSNYHLDQSQHILETGRVALRLSSSGIRGRTTLICTS